MTFVLYSFVFLIAVRLLFDDDDDVDDDDAVSNHTRRPAMPEAAASFP